LRLAELVQGLGGSAPPLAGGGPQITGVHLDSRQVGAGDLFAALPGTRDDGSRFAADALARGAAAILAPRPLELPATAAAFQWVHPDARRVAGEAAALAYGQPARGMFVVGITGTNGKTTTAHLVGHLLRAAGRRPAVLGTTGNRLADGRLLPATHTTPDAPALQRLLVRHREFGGDSVALEASSHALDQERTAGIAFDVAIFTNLTRDHLDYHGDLERYATAKERLFLSLRAGAAAIVHADDPAGERMARAARSRGARVLTYSARLRGDLVASALKSDLSGTQIVLSGMGISRTSLRLPLAGRHNVENALAAAAAALLSGASPSDVLGGLASASPAPGRLEPVETGGRGFKVLVDYAHSEDALQNVCRAVRGALDGSPGRPGRRGRLIVVFGCGGDRDRGKRGPMGRVVNEVADLAIVTSDNPRGEDPLSIIDEVLAGMEPGLAERLVEPDRRRAIEAAVARARAGDVVLIAGKGHETTQTVGDRVVDFDDRRVAAEALR
jgi:UDP-N-acetylmuramoyl-L-alanyl-D-glutamate--2,6-diaminopimelate ligase